jgi:hypothetical protein
MGSKSRDQLGDAESRGGSVSQNARRKGPQPALTVARRTRLDWGRADKRTHTPFRRDDACAFQL